MGACHEVRGAPPSPQESSGPVTSRKGSRLDRPADRRNSAEDAVPIVQPSQPLSYRREVEVSASKMPGMATGRDN
jgi:hypothetical protein